MEAVSYTHLDVYKRQVYNKSNCPEFPADAFRSVYVDSKQEALAGYDIFKASVINNSVTHADNYITQMCIRDSFVSGFQLLADVSGHYFYIVLQHFNIGKY